MIKHNGKLSFKNILPGIFLIGFNIGTGSVTAMSKAGADYGMALLWALVLSCIFAFFLIHHFGKFTIISGITFIHAIRKNIHPALALFFLIAIGINVSGSIMGVMGIVSDVLHEWSKEFLRVDVSPLLWAILLNLLIISLFLIGNLKFFQRALSIMVGLMAVSFLVNAIIMIPSIADILDGLIPKIPDNGNSSRSGYLIATSMVGTTLAPVILVARSVLVKSQGWGKGEMSTQKRDAIVSASMMFLISAAIIASAAGTLHLQGIKLENPSEMISLLKPVAGAFAVNIFVLGITAAGISSQFPNVFILPWIIADYKGIQVKMKDTTTRIVVIFMASLGIVVPLFNARPILVMISSQALGAILLPMAVACMMYLGNSRKLMGGHRLSTTQNVIFGIIFLFSLIMCSLGIYGLFGNMTS